MALEPRFRPVSASQQWPEASRDTAEALHRLLTIDNRNWHAYKAQPQRRAAEQLAAALVILLDPANPPNAPLTTEQRRQSIELLEHGLGWLRGERKDPGCPNHGH
ncbi:MAG: hypothetical protein FJ077_13515 [Cyanobacteria bacterium K_DeepCast_35m_m2_023]|nr:hypothetical protein [Cyanobacteria bacterium K_DeepCast_35m_m2_023]